jgi:hypothetical protein
MSALGTGLGWAKKIAPVQAVELNHAIRKIKHGQVGKDYMMAGWLFAKQRIIEKSTIG